METIAEAKEFLRKHFVDGSYCPCCGQQVKLYNRPFNSAQAIGLIKLVRFYANDPRYYHVTEIGVTESGGEFARLERWGLISSQVNEDTAKRTSGMWKPTEEGIRFARGITRVPSHILLFNRRTYGFSDTYIDIRDALGKKFNYSDLMGEPAYMRPIEDYTPGVQEDLF